MVPCFSAEESTASVRRRSALSESPAGSPIGVQRIFGDRRMDRAAAVALSQVFHVDPDSVAILVDGEILALRGAEEVHGFRARLLGHVAEGRVLVPRDIADIGDGAGSMSPNTPSAVPFSDRGFWKMASSWAGADRTLAAKLSGASPMTRRSLEPAPGLKSGSAVFIIGPTGLPSNAVWRTWALPTRSAFRDKRTPSLMSRDKS